MRSLLDKNSVLLSSMVIIIALVVFTEAELEPGKNRRGGGGTSGLFAFPRVGRSDPSMSSSLHDMDNLQMESLYAPATLEDYDDYAKNELKRSSLMVFPRIGRTDNELRKWAHMLALQQAMEKRTGPSATSGLWFGPRLGKRSSMDVAQHKLVGQKEDY